MTGRRVLLGLIGANIQRSLSPALHEHACSAAGMHGYYHLMDLDRLPGRRLEDLFDAVRNAGFQGVNITFPCKEAILPLLHQVSDEADEIGAVNTVTIGADGRTVGYNTDRVGFRRSFEETLGRAAIAGKTAALIGAGGAGRAVAYALMDLGARCVLVHDREASRAELLVAQLTAHFGHGRSGLTDASPAALAEADGLINATPLGMQGFPGSPIAPDALRVAHWVADIIYSPLETQLIKAARLAGAEVLTGGGMCVHQAVEAFRLFTGISASAPHMHEMFARALAIRDGSAPPKSS
jgi:shikimate dehydrogenase